MISAKPHIDNIDFERVCQIIWHNSLYKVVYYLYYYSISIICYIVMVFYSISCIIVVYFFLHVSIAVLPFIHVALVASFSLEEQCLGLTGKRIIPY